MARRVDPRVLDLTRMVQCPVCRYAMSDLDLECPRCARRGQATQPQVVPDPAQSLEVVRPEVTDTMSRRHAANHKAVRNDEIIAGYRDGELCSQVARNHKVKRQRVHQILVSSGIPTPLQVERHCRHCGSLLNGNQRIRCEACRHVPAPRILLGTCYICGAAIDHRNLTGRCIRHHRSDPWRDNEIITLYARGLTEREVGVQFGVSVMTISNVLCGAHRGPGPGVRALRRRRQQEFDIDLVVNPVGEDWVEEQVVDDQEATA